MQCWAGILILIYQLGKGKYKIWFTLFKTMALNEVRVHLKYILDMQIFK